MATNPRPAAQPASPAPDPRNGQVVETNIPQRLDRLPWSRWHVCILISLGTSWLLDGLEVMLVGSFSGILQSEAGMRLTDTQNRG